MASGSGRCSRLALLAAGWIGLYQMGVPVWMPWTFGPVQIDTSVAEKAKANADAQRLADAKATADADAKRQAEAEQQRLAALKAEQERTDAKRVADAKATADAEAKR